LQTPGCPKCPEYPDVPTKRVSFPKKKVSKAVIYYNNNY